MERILMVPFGWDCKPLPEGDVEIPAGRYGMSRVPEAVEQMHLPEKVPGWCGVSDPDVFESVYGRRPSRMFLPGHADQDEIWALLGDERVPLADRLCLAASSEGCLARKRDFGVLASAFRAFAPPSSLPMQADVLDALAGDPRVSAVGWQRAGDVAGWRELGGSGADGKGEPYDFSAPGAMLHRWLDELVDFRRQPGARIRIY